MRQGLKDDIGIFLKLAIGVAVVVALYSLDKHTKPYGHECSEGDRQVCIRKVQADQDYQDQKRLLLNYRLATGEDLK